MEENIKNGAAINDNEAALNMAKDQDDNGANVADAANANNAKKDFDEGTEKKIFLGFIEGLFRGYDVLDKNDKITGFLPERFSRTLLYKILVAWCMNIDVSIFKQLKEKHFEEVYVTEELNKRLIDYIQDKGYMGEKVSALIEDCKNANEEVEEIKDSVIKDLRSRIGSYEGKIEALVTDISNLKERFENNMASVPSNKGSEDGRLDNDGTQGEAPRGGHGSGADRAASDQSARDAVQEQLKAEGDQLDKDRDDHLIERLRKMKAVPYRHEKEGSFFSFNRKKARKHESLNMLDEFRSALLDRELSKEQKNFLLTCATEGIDVNILLKVADPNMNTDEMLRLIELYSKVHML